MTLSRAQKVWRAAEETRRNNATVKRTGLCVVCSSAPVYDTPGGKSMTCTRSQCRRAYILFELAKCPNCGSYDFRRLMGQEDKIGNKLYECANCGVVVDRRRVVIETPETEDDNEIQVN